MSFAPVARRPWPRRRCPTAPRSSCSRAASASTTDTANRHCTCPGTLENTGRFQVTIGEDAAILETPAIRKYDLIIVNADRRDPEFKFTPGQQEAIFDFVRSGHGYVSIHGADNAATDWLPPWKEMLGGIFSHVGQPDGKAQEGILHRQDRRYRQPDHAGAEGFPAQG